MILECMVVCFVRVLFLHSLPLMVATNCFPVVITIAITLTLTLTLTTVEEKSGEVHLVARTTMEKVMIRVRLGCHYVLEDLADLVDL